MKTKTAQITPREVLKKTGCRIYADEKVLKNAPVGELQKVEWFNIGKYVTREELEKEYEDRGLEPVNLNTLAANADAHDFTATIWEDGGPLYAAFGRWDGDRDVDVSLRDYDWDDDWWFAGRRKQPSELEAQPLNSEPLNSALPPQGGPLDVMNARLNKIEAILAYHNLTEGTH